MKKITLFCLFLSTVLICNAQESDQKSLVIKPCVSLSLGYIPKVGTETVHDVGYSYQRTIGNKPVASIAPGIKISHPSSGLFAKLEIDGRCMIAGGGYAVAYPGGRVGIGYTINDDLSIAGLYGKYDHFQSTDNPEKNYWLNGFSAQLHYRKWFVEASKIEFYQISIGAFIVFDTHQ